MRDALIASVTHRFRSYDDLIAAIESRQLRQKLDAPRHKSLLEHLWCVVGARESYAQALSTGAWGGFACSMTQQHSRRSRGQAQGLRRGRTRSHRVGRRLDQRARPTAHELDEREVMHEGGIIPHMYAFELDIPASVKWA